MSLSLRKNKDHLLRPAFQRPRLAWSVTSANRRRHTPQARRQTFTIKTDCSPDRRIQRRRSALCLSSFPPQNRCPAHAHLGGRAAIVFFPAVRFSTPSDLSRLPPAFADPGPPGPIGPHRRPAFGRLLSRGTFYPRRIGRASGVQSAGACPRAVSAFRPLGTLSYGPHARTGHEPANRRRMICLASGDPAAGCDGAGDHLIYDQATT